MSRTYQVAFATVDLLGLFGDAGDEAFRGALLESWKPGDKTVRYNRRWQVSRPRLLEDNDVVGGRIGFVNEDELGTLEWDEEEEDFVRGRAPGGVVVPFAIHVPSRVVAFQLVAGHIRPTSFTGALEGILGAGSAYGWRVRQLVERLDYEEWSTRIERIVHFNFRIEKPNPHYADNDIAEQLLEEMRLAVATVRGSGDDIDDESASFQQLIDHVRRRYGRGKVRGQEAGGYESEWRSTDGGAVPAIERVESEEEVELPEQVLPGLISRIVSRMFQRREVYTESSDDADAEED